MDEEYGWFIDPATGKERRLKVSLADRWGYQRARPANVTDIATPPVPRKTRKEPATPPVAQLAPGVVDLTGPPAPPVVAPEEIPAEYEVHPEEPPNLIRPLDETLDVNDGGAYVIIAFRDGYQGIKSVSAISGKETQVTAHLIVSALIDGLQEARKAENQIIDRVYSYANDLGQKVKIRERVGKPTNKKKGGKR